MRKKLVLFFLLSLIVLTIFLSLETNFLDDSHQNETSSVNVTFCEGRNTCDIKAIEQRISDCRDPVVGDVNCSYTEENLESVTLVADSHNYVTAPPTDESYRVEILEENVQPWDIEFLPSGNPIWTNEGGEIKMRKNESVQNLKRLDVLEKEALGILGLAIDPDFGENNYIYVYYSHNRTDNRTMIKYSNSEFKKIIETRLSRFRLEDGELQNETVLLTVPGSSSHSGGGLEFGPDEKLYLGTGDASMYYKASKLSFLGGKILRLNADGSIPEDNPFDESPVYSIGHRNPQGLAWQPETQTLYNTEHGPWRHDEINKVQPGKNYGWSGFKCDEKTNLTGRFVPLQDPSPQEYMEFENTEPAKCFDSWTLAPSGATFVNDTESPWHGDLFIAGLRSKHIFRLKFENMEPTTGEVFYSSVNNSKISLRMREVEYHKGSLYFAGDLGGMGRITPVSDLSNESLS